MEMRVRNFNNVAQLRSINKGKQPRIAHITPIPVGLTIYDYGLKCIRQAGGSHHHVRGHFLPMKNFLLAGANVGGCNEQLDAFGVAGRKMVQAIHKTE